MVAAHGRPRAAGRASAPGRRGGGASQQAVASGRAASDRGVGEGGRRGLRIADTHLPGGGAEDGLVQGPVREPGETSPRRGRSGHGQGL